MLRKLKKLALFLSGARRLGASPADRWRLAYLLYRWRIVDNWPWTAALLPPISRVTIRTSGRPVPLSIPDDLSFPHVFYEVFLTEDYEMSLRRPPRVIFDLGAQFGLATVFFATRFPEAQVFSFEPASRNFRVLKENAASLPNVRVFNLAVAGRRGTVRLYLNERGGENSIVSTTGRYEEVDAIPFEEALRQAGVDRVDLLKIDVEGAEGEILTESVLDRIDQMVAELHLDVLDRGPFLERLERHFTLKTHLPHPLRPTVHGLHKSLAG